MGLSRKRKQQLREITGRSLESRKLRKLDQENYRRKEILRRQREEEDFWDEYEDISMDSSSDSLALMSPVLMRKSWWWKVVGEIINKKG